MAGVLLGFLVAGIIGGFFVFECYDKREVTERKLRQNVSNLEHNLDVIRKESDTLIENLNKELIKTKEQNKKAFNDIDILQRDCMSLQKQLEDCRSRLET